MTDREPVRADQLVDAELDRQAIAHLDKDIDPKCGFGVIPMLNGAPAGPPAKCGKPAEWIATCRTCNAMFWSCSTCRQATFLLDRVRCGSCQTLLPGKDLFAFDPIPGGA